jgi:hypothetical protein
MAFDPTKNPNAPGDRKQRVGGILIAGSITKLMIFSLPRAAFAIEQ